MMSLQNVMTEEPPVMPGSALHQYKMSPQGNICREYFHCSDIVISQCHYKEILS